MKGALVCANGVMKNYRYGFDNFVKNLVAYNDLDVYLFLQKNTSTKIRFGSEPDIHDETAYLKEKLGDRLKLLYWTDENVEFDEFRKPLMDMQKNRLEHLNQMFAGICFDGYLGGNDYVVDQYVRLSHAAMKFQDYCESHKLHYDYVIRYRVDITSHIEIPFKHLPMLHPRQCYAVDNGGVSIRDALFISSYEDFLIISKNYIYAYGTYVPPLRNVKIAWLSPECQFAQFLFSLGYKVYGLKMEAELCATFDKNTLSWYPKSDFEHPLKEITLIPLRDFESFDEKGQNVANTKGIIGNAQTSVNNEESNAYMIVAICFIVFFVLASFLFVYSLIRNTKNETSKTLEVQSHSVVRK